MAAATGLVTAVPTKARATEEVLMELIRDWMEASEAGDAIMIELVDMTDEEVENLPEV